jgi:hypothetical protein
MDERTIFVDEFQDAASKDGDWLIIGKFTESFTINFISPLSSYAQITNVLFFFKKTMRNDHFLSGKHLK